MLTDDALYVAYRWNAGTRTGDVVDPSDCVDECRVEFVCELMTSSDQRYDECLVAYSEP